MSRKGLKNSSKFHTFLAQPFISGKSLSTDEGLSPKRM